MTGDTRPPDIEVGPDFAAAHTIEGAEALIRGRDTRPPEDRLREALTQWATGFLNGLSFNEPALQERQWAERRAPDVAAGILGDASVRAALAASRPAPEPNELAKAAVREGTHREAVDDFGTRYLAANLQRSSDPDPLRAAAEWLLREPPDSLTEHESCIPKFCPVAAIRAALSAQEATPIPIDQLDTEAR